MVDLYVPFKVFGFDCMQWNMKEIGFLFIHLDKDKMRSLGDYLVSIIGMGGLGNTPLPLDESLLGATTNENI